VKGNRAARTHARDTVPNSFQGNRHREDVIMLRKQIAIAALILGASGTASAYETGRLTCQNVGQLAAHMLMARQSGISPQAYLSALDEKLPADAKVERELVMKIAEVVYQDDDIAQMQPEQAFLMFAQNCVQGQEQDQMSGQRDEAAPDEDDNESMDEDDQREQ
jgi:hypothetical protein